MGKMANVAIIILAAGSSSRMGHSKQLLKWGNTTLLNHSILQASNSEAENVYVVLGANYKEIKASIKNKAVFVLHNPTWEEGMGNSIAFGIKEVASNTYDGVLIMLADQPQVDAVFLNSLIRAFQKREKHIIATSYKNGAGVPALFDKTCFGELTSITGKMGAKSLIKRSMETTKLIVPKNKILDIDTKEMYEKAKSIFLNQQI